MIKLSPKEKKVYDMLLSGTINKIARVNLGMNENDFNVHKTHMRRKIAASEAFLELMKPVYPMLYPKKQYKGISKRRGRK